MVPQWIIEKKRDGGALSSREWTEFMAGYVRGEIPDYQMAALAMAVCWRGMNVNEVVGLTEAMIASGDRIDTAALGRPRIDKHSTGGIGDKISLILAPLVACCGVAVPMIAGRGLGLTGGTLDKLESIPGYRTDLSEREFLAVLDGCGCSIIGQTQRIVPADRKLYALRDVTGTVPSVPLIAASILSKKIAEGIQGLVLDVKCGAGAFMPTLADARDLARTLATVSRKLGCETSAFITDMSQPLGHHVGNSLEVTEALQVLGNQGPADVREITLVLGARMLTLARVEPDEQQARQRLTRALASGEALAKFREMVRLQGGDVAALEAMTQPPATKQVRMVTAAQDGFVTKVDAAQIGRACLLLGAGRSRLTDLIDPAAGVSRLAKVGDRATRGEPLICLHAATADKIAAALPLAEAAFAIGSSPMKPPSLILEGPL